MRPRTEVYEGLSPSETSQRTSLNWRHDLLSYFHRLLPILTWLDCAHIPTLTSPMRSTQIYPFSRLSPQAIFVVSLIMRVASDRPGNLKVINFSVYNATDCPVLASLDIITKKCQQDSGRARISRCRRSQAKDRVTATRALLSVYYNDRVNAESIELSIFCLTIEILTKLNSWWAPTGLGVFYPYS